MNSKFYHTKETVEQYIKMAEGYNSKVLIDKLKTYASGKTLLELGSGPGTDWSYLNEYYEVTGSDYSDEFLKRLKEKYPSGTFINLAAESIKTDKKFDIIYSNKVLHHLNDQELKQSIKSQLNVLKDGGIICHSFWKGEGTEVYDGIFVNNHTTDSLKTFFEPLFEVLYLETYKEFEEDDSLLLIAKAF